jgi:HAMP domain-containing protein
MPAFRRTIALLLALSCGTPLPAMAATRALVGGTVIDGTGSAPMNDAVVLVEGERIVAVGRRGDVTIPADAELLPASGLTVMPGLIDLGVYLTELGHTNRAHWHEYYQPIAARAVMPLAAASLLAAGVTTARDLGAPLDPVVALRHRIAAGELSGPTLVVAGPVIERQMDPQGAGRSVVARDATELRHEVARLAQGHVDYLLLAGAADYGAADLAAFNYAADDAGLAWFALVRTDADIAPAIAAGARGLIGLGDSTSEHLPAVATNALRARAATGHSVPWVLGASVATNLDWLAANRAPLDDPRWRESLPPVVADDLRASLDDPNRYPADRAGAGRAHATLISRLNAIREAGAHLLVGSFAGEPGHLTARATWQEAELLVRDAGMTPVEAIRALTEDAALLLGVGTERGSLLPGKTADIIAVRGDVLRDIAHLENVEIVLHRGTPYRCRPCRPSTHP